jgi:hypothetical protein
MDNNRKFINRLLSIFKRNDIEILLLVAFFCLLAVPAVWFIYSLNEDFKKIGTIHELERIQSPDKLVDGVIVQWGGGAMNPDWYAVYVVPPNHEIDQDTDSYVFLGRHKKMFELHWLENKALRIKGGFDPVHFQPSVAPFKNNADYKVTVILDLPEKIKDINL